jgi:hypothetical protein
MALARYIVTKATTVPQGTLSTAAAGEPGTGGAAGFGNASTSAGYGVFAQTFLPGTAIILDSASALYAALNGAGALRAWVQGQDDIGHAALANLTGWVPARLAR